MSALTPDTKRPSKSDVFPDVLPAHPKAPDFRFTTLGITVQPCCLCVVSTSCGRDPYVDGSSESGLETQSPCNSLPARFMAVKQSYKSLRLGVPFNGWDSGPNATDIFAHVGVDLQYYFNFSDAPLAALNTLFQNVFQSLYHIVRMELEVILDNQIYTSPTMYSRSISEVYVPGAANQPSTTNYSRHGISTDGMTVALAWPQYVQLFNESARIPVMLYLRSIPRLKPLGSAITSVFVSTFAMLSVLWMTFNVIAAVVAEWAR
ncbi:hypothetical protein FB451DRAFT_1280794 [Mycena latifolia]|nr:hypothetical protein FB451DRAFT_1280794 [Mycena latifolia]